MPAPVYYSIVEIPGDGVTTQHEFSFAGGYISQDHVKAYTQDADGVITPVTVTGGMFVTAGTLDLGVAAPVGGLTRIYRDTPKDEPLANFTGGSRITEANLDLLAAQTVFAVAEAFDAGAYAVVNDLLGAAGAAAGAAGVAAAAAEAAAVSAAADAAAAAASAESVDLSTKADIAGDDFTGPITVPAGATGTQVPRVQEVAKLTGATFTGPVNDTAGSLRAIPVARTAASGGSLLATDAGLQVTLSGAFSLALATLAEGDSVVLLNPTASEVALTITGTAYVSGIDTVRTTLSFRRRGICTVMRSGSTLWFSGAVA